MLLSPLTRLTDTAGRMPSISVVVPTRDRPASLARCLAALAGQTAGDELEIVVVDDASRDADAVGALVATHARTRSVRGEGRGPAAARNAGARAASGRVICFTDDDCEPVPTWAEALSARVRAGADAVAGTTVNPDPRDRLAAASELIATHLTAFSFRPDGVPFAASNNLACTASLLETVPFDEHYATPGGEDRDWCARLAALGFELVREPAAVVEHRQDLDLRRFWQRNARFGRAARRFHATHARGLTPSPVALYAGLVREGFRAGPGVGALVCLAQLATASGYVGATHAPPPPADGSAPGSEPRPG
jgi:glycosyltransferase involved in cell wall biosynthesis